MSDQRGTLDYERFVNALAGAASLLAVGVCILSNAPALIVLLPALMLGAAIERVLHLRARRQWEAEQARLEVLVQRAERALDAQSVVMRIYSSDHGEH